MKKIILILFLVFFSVINAISQDLIYKKDGSKMDVKIIQSHEQFIEYQDHEENRNKMATSDISAIFYEDGKTKIFSNEKKTGENQITSAGSSVSVPTTRVAPSTSAIDNSSNDKQKNTENCFEMVDVRSNKNILSRIWDGRKHTESKDKKGITKSVISDLKSKLNSKGFCNKITQNSNEQIEIRITKVLYEGVYDFMTGIKGSMIVEIEVTKIVSGFSFSLGTYSGNSRANISMAGQKKFLNKFDEATDNLLTNMGL